MTPASTKSLSRWVLSVASLFAVSSCQSAAAPPAGPADSADEWWSGDIVKDRPQALPLPATGAPGRMWPPTLTEAESAKCREVAWSAVRDPAMWSRFFEYPPDSSAVPLTERGVQCALYQRDLSRVEVQIPSGGHVGWHGTYVGVTVERGTYTVLRLYSSFWL